MKKRSKSDTTSEENSIQEMITSLHEDLMTVLDGHMDEMEMQEVFYNAIKFTTFAMYECLKDHKLSLKVLRMAMDHGIQMHMTTKEINAHSSGERSS